MNPENMSCRGSKEPLSAWDTNSHFQSQQISTNGNYTIVPLKPIPLISEGAGAHSLRETRTALKHLVQYHWDWILFSGQGSTPSEERVKFKQNSEKGMVSKRGGFPAISTSLSMKL